MILAAVAGLAAATAAAPQGQSAQGLLNGAEHALRVGRLDQAKLMVARAVGAGASGIELDRALADLAYALGRNDEALARYESLLKTSPENQSYLEPAGIAALRAGNDERAFALLSRATSLPSPSWRAWNALGVVADFRSNWSLADKCFEEAARLAPSNSEPINNHGWSLLSRGKWDEALIVLEHAVALDPNSTRTKNNLELARAALASDLPARQPGETGVSWASRLNDAGMAAELLGNRQRAVAAFSRALEASDHWYERAANNLEAISAR